METIQIKFDLRILFRMKFLIELNENIEPNLLKNLKDAISDKLNDNHIIEQFYYFQLKSLFICSHLSQLLLIKQKIKFIFLSYCQVMVQDKCIIKKKLQKLLFAFIFQYKGQLFNQKISNVFFKSFVRTKDAIVMIWTLVFKFVRWRNIEINITR